MSNEEVDADLLEAFKAADKDNTGTLSREEFTEVLSKMAQFDTPEKIAEAVAKADKDGSGVICYKEFSAFANDDDA
jgi:Ca2+-binding EF-hand superfamily protein